jgi:hypothetical protein
MHLTPDELIDVAEGTRRESSLPHLASCGICRRQVADLRAVLSTVASIQVPEPSPLFWEHFSIRVRDAIAADPAGSGWRWVWTRFRTPLVLAATPAVLVLCVLGARVIAPRLLPSPDATASLASSVPAAGQGTARDTLASDDPTFLLVADLAGPIDLDTAEEAGLADQSSAEHAVAHLSQGELKELHRLLKRELGNSTN